MKPPAIQFYTGDWFKDSELSLCEAATRGIWIDFLFRMHDRDRCGQLEGTRKGLAQLARCTEPELDAALLELSRTKTATVTERNGIITVTNRRMRRDWEERQAAAKRAKNYRKRQGEETDTGESQENNADRHGESSEEITFPSSSSSSSSERLHTAREPENPEFRNQVQAVFDAYPAVRRKDRGTTSKGLYSLDALTMAMRKNPDYPWLEHTRLYAALEDCPKNHVNWLQSMPDHLALKALREAAPPETPRRRL